MVISLLIYILSLAPAVENYSAFIWIANAVIGVESVLLLWLTIKHLRCRSKRCEASSNSEKQNVVVADTIPDPNIDPSALFLLLSRAIVEEELFLNPLLNRQMLMDRFSVNKERIGKAFASADTSLPVFIRDCRLEYARTLIKQHPEVSLTQVATMSGFTTRESFGRSFKQKYAISPSEYKEQ